MPSDLPPPTGPPVGAPGDAWGQPPPPPAPPGGGDAGRFAAPRQLHPASIVLGVPLRQLLQGLVVPAVIGASAGPGLWFGAAMILAVLAVGAVVRVLGWQRFRYSFDGTVLRVEEGVLSRNVRSLDVARIQQVEVDRSLGARVLGLASLRVETAGNSGEAEVELRVIPEPEAQALRAAVRASKASLQGAGAAGAVADASSAAATAAVPGDAFDRPPTERTVVRISPGRIVLSAVSGSRLLVLPAVLAASLQFLGDAAEVGGGTLDPETLARRALALGVVGIVALLIPASLASATAVGLLRDWGWTMRRVDEDLHVSRGLLSTRESVLPLARVQRVEVQRNWIRRALGFAAIRVHSAGGSGSDDRRVTIPLVRDDEVDGLVGELLPGVDRVPTLHGHPTGARRRAVFRWVRASLVPAAALLLIPWVPGQLRVLGWALPVVAAVLGLVEYGQLAHGRTDRVLAARSGALSVTTGFAPLVKVQGVTRRASPFQRRLGLATLTAHVAGPGGDLTVLDLGDEAAAVLHRRLVRAAAAPHVPEELQPDPADRPGAPPSAWVQG